MLYEFYSFRGRLGRIAFLWRIIVWFFLTLLFLVASLYTMQLLNLFGTVGSLLTILMLIAWASFVFIPSLALTFQRFHDFNMSGWIGISGFILNFFYLGYSVLIVIQAGGINALESMDNETLINTFGPKLMQLKILNIISLLLFFVTLGLTLFWPGTKGDNKYGEYTGFNPDILKQARQARVSKPQKGGAVQSYIVTFKYPVDEEELHLFKHIRQEHKDIQKINLPASRDQAEFILSLISPKKPKDIKRLLKETGLPVKSVKLSN